MASSRKLFAAWFKPKIPFPNKREIHAGKRITAAVAEEIHNIQSCTFIKI
jgi:hypothetical protein